MHLREGWGGRAEAWRNRRGRGAWGAQQVDIACTAACAFLRVYLDKREDTKKKTFAS